MKIKEKIADTLRKISELEKVESEFSSVDDKKNKLNNELQKLLDLLDKKNHEISKLEKFSIGRVIKSVFVDRKKLLEEKRNEYYDLSQRYEKLKSEIRVLDYEYSILERKYNDLLKYKKELQALLKKREEELLSEDSTDGLTYRNIIGDIEKLEKEKSKVLVSISIINKLFNKLTLLSAALREVDGYADWKGRRRIRNAESYKDIAIRNAKQYLLESNLTLKKLEQSLADIRVESVDLYLKPIEFKGFVNVIFDNFITDIILKKKINDALDNIDDVYQNLNILKKDLRKKTADIDKKIIRLEQVKKEVVSNVK